MVLCQRIVGCQVFCFHEEIILTFNRTAAKVNFISSPFLPTLQAEIPIDYIPESLGGNYRGWNTPFEFDQAEDGLLAYPHRSFPFNISKVSTEEEKTSGSASPASPDDVKLQST